ncbi:MAG: hypothetical protein WCR20_21305 [Verrucomicrobiota bacterium]
MATHKGGAVAPRIQVCPAPKGKIPNVLLLFGLKKPENGYSFVFGKLSVETFKYSDLEFPLKGYTFNWDYLLDCYEDKNIITAGAILESFLDDNNEIFLSYNSKLT